MKTKHILNFIQKKISEDKLRQILKGSTEIKSLNKRKKQKNNI